MNVGDSKQSIYVDIAQKVHDEIIDCYRSYYNRLKETGYVLEKAFEEYFPLQEEDHKNDSTPGQYAKFQTLVYNCCTNSNIMPIGHVVLTRFAQYCIQEKIQYQTINLIRNPLVFNLEPDITRIYSNAVKTKCDETLSMLAQELCKNIRKVLFDNLNNSYIVNMKQVFLKWEKPNFSYKFKLKHCFSMPIFPFESFIVLLCLSYQLDENQTKEFIEYAKSRLTSKNSTQELTVGLSESPIIKEDFLNNICKLMHPNFYFTHKAHKKSTKEDTLKRKLKKNIKPLVNRNIVKISDSQKSFKTNLYTQLYDFTNLSLYLSGAIFPTYQIKKRAPSYFEEQMKSLNKSLSEYKNDKYLFKILNVKFKQTRLITFENDHEIKALHIYIAKSMDWEKAKSFLSSYLISKVSSKDNDIFTQQIPNLINTLYKEGFSLMKRHAFPESDLSQRNKEELYLLFKYAIHAALKELQSEVLRQLIQASQAYTNSPPISKTPGSSSDATL